MVMSKQTITLVLEKETKNTFRYLEDSEFPVIRNIYIAKRVTTSDPPRKIKVTIAPIEE